MLVLAGSGRVTFTGGAVVDVTTGTTVSSGTSLSVNHRYLVAEDTTAAFTVTSKTAVVDYQGPYAFRYSGTTDYNAMAAALKTMHLFQGSFTGYGQGYDLEVAPTRMQALIMFIRVLGEEDEALAYTGTCPFKDVAAGSQSAKYAGYAYSKGYTNGYSADTFRPSQTVTASQFVEFILRALGYSSVETSESLPDPVQSAGQRRDHPGRTGGPAERLLPPGRSSVCLLLRPGCRGGGRRQHPAGDTAGQGDLYRRRGASGCGHGHQPAEIKSEPLP